MTELKETTIQAIHKISEAIKDTEFFLNRFEVNSAGDGRQIIEVEIREKDE